MKKNVLYQPYLVKFFVCLVITQGCKTANIKGPEENYLEKVVKVHQSTINIPIQVPMAQLENKINGAINGLLYEDSSMKDNGNDNLMIKVWKRSDISIQAEGELFKINVPLKVWARAALDLSEYGLNIGDTKETNFELNLNFITKIGVGEDWQVVSQTSGNGFEWIKKPKIKIGFFEISVASFLGDVIDHQQEEVSNMLDQQISRELDIKKHVQKAWNQMQDPMLVSKEHDAWMKITPQDVKLTGLYGQGGVVKANIGITGTTATHVGGRPAKAAYEPLAQLQVSDQVNNDFTIGLIGEITHERAKQLLAENFVNKTLTFNNEKKEVTITSIDLYGSGENIVIQAGLKGDIDGVIYLSGQPYYNEEDQTLSIGNLDYDLNTKNRLAKTASWFAKSRFLKQMEDAFKLPLGKEIEEAKNMIRNNFDHQKIGEGIFLDGKLRDFSPSEVYITPQSIVAVILATGQAEINISELK